MTTTGAQQPCVRIATACSIKRSIGQARDSPVAKHKLVLNGTIRRGDTQLASCTVDGALCATMTLVAVQYNLEESKLRLNAATDGDLAGVMLACEGNPDPDYVDRHLG